MGAPLKYLPSQVPTALDVGTVQVVGAFLTGVALSPSLVHLISRTASYSAEQK